MNRSKPGGNENMGQVDEGGITSETVPYSISGRQPAFLIFVTGWTFVQLCARGRPHLVLHAGYRSVISPVEASGKRS